MKTDYVRLSWHVANTLRANLSHTSRAIVAKDRIIVDLINTETEKVCERWRLSGSAFEPNKIYENTIKTIQLCDANTPAASYILTVEWIGHWKDHWLSWLPPLRTQSANERVATLRSRLTSNQKTMLDCAARTLTDAIIRVDERALLLWRAIQEDEESSEDERTTSNAERATASFYVLFDEPLPLPIMPLLIAMSPLQCAGRLPETPDIFYAMTPLGCALELTPYGVGDALPLRVVEDMFCLLDVNDSTAFAFDVPFDIEGGKMPFRNTFNEIVYF